MNAPKFSSPPASVYSDLRKHVNSYFSSNNLPFTGNRRLYIKAISFILSYVALYVHLVFFTPPTVFALLECALMGLLTAFLGFNVMHDGAHGSFSNKSWVNKAAALSLDFLGASSFMWNSKHNTIHHTFTNIDGVDDDIQAGPFLKLAPTQKHYKFHKYQHYYFWLLYGLLHLFWIFYTDYKKYFKGAIGNMPIKKMTLKDHLVFWGFKLFYLIMYVVVPIYFVGLGAWAIGFVVYAVTSGLVLSIVFQLAHSIEETAFPEVIASDNKMPDEWAIHQLKTTANFATKNKLVTWCLGGLNYQIEHHLFPKVSHVHYPAISKIVRKRCDELGLKYIEHETMTTAIISHVGHLRRLGRRHH